MPMWIGCWIHSILPSSGADKSGAVAPSSKQDIWSKPPQESVARLIDRLVIRLTDLLDMAKVVDWDIKHHKQIVTVHLQ